MKRKQFWHLLFILTIFMLTGCGHNLKTNDNHNKVQESEYDTMESITTINLIINNQNYKATIEENETAKAFTKTLPISFNMRELNGNEKYVYMDNILPTNPSNPKHIEVGDIMLYGNNCLVIFYKSFESSYSYTKIGHIDNLPNLGSDNVTVTFTKE